MTMDKLAGKAFLLHLGLFALAIPLVVVERWSNGITGQVELGQPNLSGLSLSRNYEIA